ncbi:DeoR/GlpR family DNA-binding transcription regulator [Mycoplasma sp. Ms02]|uniref:DeoR/GlpR family DNA-binding transcription regulator n=1 Tax=Mycoplasma sp. Ms02 TaxID=353851 RepID=UPI001C8ADDD0|nr:DeoR/GlpR family DNA-binding transcription regulator [Mycoplasma sp. Ms02]QZE12117.1 DeoR/GlpR family DNA-binding transcription regulator [Mycoplasma sp. Ms02]
MSVLIENQIKDLIKDKKVLKPREIQEAFNLTLATTRRYLLKLEQQNIIKRNFGEIIYIEEENSYIDSDAVVKINTDAETKKQIAQKAAQLVGDHKTVYLDAGSSCYYLLDYLPKDLIIYTNSIINAQRAIILGFESVNIIGGMIKPTTYGIVDLDLEFLSKITFPISFMGVNAISKDGCLMTPEKRECLSKAQIAEKSDLVIALAETKKFDRLSVFDFTPKNKTVIVVTEDKKLVETSKYKKLTIV